MFGWVTQKQFDQAVEVGREQRRKLEREIDDLHREVARLSGQVQALLNRDDGKQQLLMTKQALDSVIRMAQTRIAGKAAETSEHAAVTAVASVMGSHYDPVMEAAFVASTPPAKQEEESQMDWGDLPHDVGLIGTTPEEFSLGADDERGESPTDQG